MNYTENDLKSLDRKLILIRYDSGMVPNLAIFFYDKYEECVDPSLIYFDSDISGCGNVTTEEMLDKLNSGMYTPIDIDITKIGDNILKKLEESGIDMHKRNEL